MQVFLFLFTVVSAFFFLCFSIFSHLFFFVFRESLLRRGSYVVSGQPESQFFFRYCSICRKSRTTHGREGGGECCALLCWASNGMGLSFYFVANHWIDRSQTLACHPSFFFPDNWFRLTLFSLSSVLRVNTSHLLLYCALEGSRLHTVVAVVDPCSCRFSTHVSTFPTVFFACGKGRR